MKWGLSGRGGDLMTTSRQQQGGAPRPRVHSRPQAGAAEPIGVNDGRYDVGSKSERMFRRIGHNQPGDFGFLTSGGEGSRIPPRKGPNATPARHAALTALCRGLAEENLAPAAALINERREALYALGPTDRYLNAAPGSPMQDLIATARVRAKLRTAIAQVFETKARVVVPGAPASGDEDPASFTIVAEPVTNEGETLVLVCFVDGQGRTQRAGRRAMAREAQSDERISRAIVEGAPASREAPASKEELQSLNAELITVNARLRQTLERERAAADDLQNVLDSTDVATLFLDANLQIRFFTPAAKSIFAIVSADIGRPLAALRPLVADEALLDHAAVVLRTHAPREREIEAADGARYLRRIMPYRTGGAAVEGVVITFADVTERARAIEALEAAKREAQQANAAKSRFLAAATHDLRQPLQTLALLQGLLAKSVEGERAAQLLARTDEALGAMAAMLNAMFDINQIEAGAVRADIVNVPVNDLLERLRGEFVYHAHSKGLQLRVVPCGFSVQSDPRLLEQMLRNLLSNAMKYTKSGKVLLGCRRLGDTLSMEVWDTGPGIPSSELSTIFEEHQRIGKTQRGGRGFGLGLAIAQRLSALLDHPIRVRSQPGRGSAFSVEAKLAASQTSPSVEPQESTPVVQRQVDPAPAPHGRPAKTAAAGPVIYVVDDDRHVRDAIRAVLEDDGRTVEDFATCEAFLEAHRPTAEACLLIDAYLPGMSGVELLQRLKDTGDSLPAIMITGNSDVPMAVQAMKAGALDFIEKPIGPGELLASVERALDQARDSGKQSAWREKAARQLAELTLREREIMDLVLAGHASKNIAAQLGISQRTVENHRAAIMKKTGSTSLPALARLALTAAWKRGGPPK
jgi:two-component system CheB/CheR fusion protein